MKESYPATPRTAPYVALSLMTLMPEGWDDTRTPRADCLRAAAGERLRDGKARKYALQVLREVLLPAGMPERFVEQHLLHAKAETPAPWGDDFWLWMLNCEAERWRSRVADYAAQFGRGRSVWWAYAELWVLELGIRCALYEMVPAKPHAVARALSEQLEWLALMQCGKQAKKVRLKRTDDAEAARKWIAGQRTPRWSGVKALAAAFYQPDTTQLTRAAMLNRALTIEEPSRQQAIQCLHERFNRAYAATTRWAMTSKDLQRMADEGSLASSLLGAVIGGTDAIAGIFAADLLASRDDLADLRDDLLAMRPGGWSARILRKLKEGAPRKDEAPWSSAMRKAEELVLEAWVLAMKERPVAQAPRLNDAAAASDWCAVERPPATPGIREKWEQALRLCRDEIADYELSKGEQRHSFVPYALGYALMYGLGKDPLESWRTRAIELGAADPQLPKPDRTRKSVECPWLYTSLLTKKSRG